MKYCQFCLVPSSSNYLILRFQFMLPIIIKKYYFKISSAFLKQSKCQGKPVYIHQEKFHYTLCRQILKLSKYIFVYITICVTGTQWCPPVGWEIPIEIDARTYYYIIYVLAIVIILQVYIMYTATTQYLILYTYIIGILS